MGSDVLKKFGRYFLLDLIAQGGMAEIYRAKEQLIQGADREVAVKRIQTGYSHNSEFVQMFKDEIKVTSQLNHPNIVQVYGGGEEDGQLYMAMELVNGKNLRQFINRFLESDKKEVPIELAVYIIEQVALGLKFAHNACDKNTDEPLRVVHRDISPQNIMISYDGSVKVFDFGIAKSKSNAEATKVGIIKGKPSYLSPEQIQGVELDGRSDIFSLGAVLWETLTGRKLFAGENEMAVIRLIESASTHVKPPSSVNPRVPKELDAIVMKALQKSVERRYQSAEELQRALHRFLYSCFPEFNPSDLAQAAKKLFHAEIVEDRKKLQRLSAEAGRLTADTGISIISDPVRVGTILESPTSRKTQADASEAETVSNVHPPGETVLPAAQAGGVAIEMEKQGIQLNSSPSAGEATQKAAVPAAPRARPPSAQPSVARETSATAYRPQRAEQGGGDAGVRRESRAGGFLAKLALLAAAAGAYIFAPQFGINLPSLASLGVRVPGTGAVEQGGHHGGEPQRSTASVTSDPPVAARASIPMRISISPPPPPNGRVRIQVSGRPVPVENPVVEVRLDEPLELTVERPGFESVRREFYIDSKRVAGLKEHVVEVALEPSHVGYLSVRTTPTADVVIQIEGTPWVRRSPFEREKLPAGNYTMKLINSILGMEKIVQIRIEEGKVVNVDERLEVRN